jgi:hypothetical protein
MLITMDSVLYWSFGLAVGYMIAFNVMDIRSHYKIFEEWIHAGGEFNIEYSDCPNWTSKVALYLIKKKSL